MIHLGAGPARVVVLPVALVLSSSFPLNSYFVSISSATYTLLARCVCWIHVCRTAIVHSPHPGVSRASSPPIPLRSPTPLPHVHSISMSFQPVSEVDAGPSLPQPTKVEGEGERYYFGRGVREPPDTDRAVLAYGDRDLDRTDARRAKAKASFRPPQRRWASSSGEAPQTQASSQPPQPHLVPARPGFGPPAKAAVLKAAPSVFTGAVEPRAASFQPPAKGPPPFHMQAIPQPMHWPKTPPPGCAPHRWQPESEPASATSSFVPAARHQPKGHAGVQFPTPSPPRPPPPTREPPQ